MVYVHRLAFAVDQQAEPNEKVFEEIHGRGRLYTRTISDNCVVFPRHQCVNLSLEQHELQYRNEYKPVIYIHVL